MEKSYGKGKQSRAEEGRSKAKRSKANDRLCLCVFLRRNLPQGIAELKELSAQCTALEFTRPNIPSISITICVCSRMWSYAVTVCVCSHMQAYTIATYFLAWRRSRAHRRGYGSCARFSSQPSQPSSADEPSYSIVKRPKSRTHCKQGNVAITTTRAVDVR